MPFAFKPLGMTPANGFTGHTVRMAGAVLGGRRRGLAAFMPFVGPAVVASVGYMDPGNFATNIQAGAAYGYKLLWVVLIANIVAMLFQAMSAKVGIVTGRNLAELCRDEFPKPVVVSMWIASEIAAIATDLAEFLGGGIGISLLFHLSLLQGLIITGIATSAVLSLDRRGFRPLEIAIATLVGVVGMSYLFALTILPSHWPAIFQHAVTPELPDHTAVMLAVGIVGATIMPHTIYLHSGLTQARTPVRNDGERRTLIRYSNREVVLALGFAGAVNLAMVVVSSDIFHLASPGTADIEGAYHALVSLLGFGAASLFLVPLIASGIASSAVGTMAGQVIMQGFVGFHIPLWLRRLVTMLPAFAAALWLDPVKAMLASQVVLSFALPLPLVALVMLSRRRTVMGDFTAGRLITVVAVAATILIVVLNVLLIGDTLR